MTKSYRVQVKVGNKFQGIQRFLPELITGGNVMYHYCFWDITEEHKQLVLDNLQSLYPKREFRMIEI